MVRTFRFLLVFLICAVFTVVTSVGFAQANPNRPRDVAFDMTEVVASGRLSDKDFNPKTEAAKDQTPSVDETQKATRVVVRGEKVERMNVGTLHVDKIVMNGRQRASGGRVAVRPVQTTVVKRVGMGKKDKTWVKKNFVSRTAYDTDKGTYVKKSQLPASALNDPNNLATVTDLDNLPVKKGLIKHSDLDSIKYDLDENTRALRTLGIIMVLVIVLIGLNFALTLWTGRSLRESIAGLSTATVVTVVDTTGTDTAGTGTEAAGAGPGGGAI